MKTCAEPEEVRLKAATELREAAGLVPIGGSVTLNPVQAQMLVAMFDNLAAQAEGWGSPSFEVCAGDRRLMADVLVQGLAKEMLREAASLGVTTGRGGH